MSSPAPPARLHAVAHGLVQGVGFRYFVLLHGHQRGLRGWVRNRPDGSVECVAEGPRPVLEHLLEDLRDGPRCARVSRVDVEWQAPRGDLRAFGVAF
jgi:acylphosphatase